MREESPVHLQPGLDGETPIWFVTRYDDVVTVLTDNERFVVDAKLALTEDELRAMDEASPLPNDDRVNTNLLTMDGEDHRRVRQLVAKAFTPRMVERLRPRIEEIADDVVDRVAAEGRMELVDDFAFPLPIIVIAELLGIPAEDRDRFRVWSNSFLLPPLTDELREQFLRHTDEFVAYLDVLFAKRRAEPSDDLLSALVQAEEHGDRLSENELYSMAVLLIVAGHETTVSLITNAVLALLGQPDELGRLQADPSLMRNAVEELLRYDSPVQGSRRIVLEDHRVRDVMIPAGTVVVTSLGSANHDPAMFGPDADQLDLRRPNAPRHLSFGSGVHHCLGASLARLEAQVALGTLVRRFDDVDLATDVPAWNNRIVLRGLDTLPVNF